MLNGNTIYSKLNAFASYIVATFAVWLMSASTTLAQNIQVNEIAENVVTTSSNLPGILTGVSFMLGLILAVQGILKFKDHVENPAQNPLRTPLIRLAAGGALFALPILFESMRALYDANLVENQEAFDPGNFSLGGALSSILGIAGIGGITVDMNAVMNNVIDGISRTPAIVAAAAYTLGILAGVVGVTKLKDHVENPDQTPLREGVIRLLIGGALFALPVLLAAASNLIAGEDGEGIMGQINSVLGTLGFFRSTFTDTFCDPSGGLIGAVLNGESQSLGASICGVATRAGATPAFLSAISYAFGLILIVWAVLKTRDHVLNPQQVKVSEAVTRFIAGGMFLALPVIIEAVRSTVTPDTLTAMSMIGANTGYNEEIGECTGLDGALACFMNDTLGPIHGLVNFFTFVAGTIFIMIGVSRLMKSAQEGAKGPGGMGTIMTFATGGMLISYNELMRAFTSTFFMVPITSTNVALSYTEGMGDAELMHAHTVLSAIIKFMIVVGLISFVRGLFIVRSVAEGNGQASMMSALTHLIGGSLAVNLGPLLNAVQTTLGITEYGITFT